MFKMEFKFSKFSSIRSKALYLGISEPTKRLAAQRIAYALRNRQGKQVFVKENKKNICVKESVKSLRYMDELFTRLMTFHYLKVTSYI